MENLKLSTTIIMEKMEVSLGKKQGRPYSENRPLFLFVTEGGDGVGAGGADKTEAKSEEGDT